MHFREWKCIDFDYCSIIGSDNYLPTGPQAIGWGLFYWHIYASLGLNELIVSTHLMIVGGLIRSMISWIMPPQSNFQTAFTQK